MSMGETSLAGIQARAARYDGAQRRKQTELSAFTLMDGISLYMWSRNRAHNRWVMQKLALFSVLMVVAPLATFFGVRAWIGPEVAYVDSWSGSAAVLMVNVVVGCYIVSAWREDDGEGGEAVPPVGRFANAKSKQQ